MAVLTGLVSTAALAAVAALGQSIEPGSGWFGVVIQAGSFGLIVYLVWYFTIKWLPRQDEKAAADRREREAREAAERVADRAASNRVARAMNKLTITLLYHDATCRGESPQKLGSSEELLKLLRGDEDEVNP